MRIPFIGNIARIVAALLLLAALPMIVYAQTSAVWTDGHGNSLWSDPTNWAPQVDPNGVFDAVIPQSVSYGPKLDTDVSIHNLTFSGQTGPDSPTTYIAGANDLTVNGVLTFNSSASIFEAGALNIVGSMQVSNCYASFWEGRVVNNSGSVALDGDGASIIISSEYDGGILFFSNQLSGAVQFNGDGTINGTPVGGFVNAGFLEKTTGASTSSISDLMLFTNTGTVSVQTGTLLFGHVIGGSSGVFYVADGAICEIANSYFNLGPGATLSGGGLYQIDNESPLYVSTDLSVSNLLCQGDLYNSNTLTIAQFLQLQGPLAGPGTTVLSPGSAAIFNDTAISQTVNNSGTVTVSNYVSFASAFNNLAGGVFEMGSSGSGEAVGGGYSGVFNNAGLLEKTAGAGTNLAILLLFTNTGTVDIQSGSLQLCVGSSSGAFNVASGATCEFGDAGDYAFDYSTFQITPGATLSGPGIYEIDFYQNLNLSTALSLSNLLCFGFLNNSNSLSVAQAFALQGTLDGPGTLNMLPGSVLALTNGFQYIYQQTINNFGTVFCADTNTLYLIESATFNNQPGGVLEAAAGAVIQGDYTEVFNNRGLFVKLPGIETNAIYPTFTNSGVVTVPNGTLQMEYGYAQTSTGALNISLGGPVPGEGYGQLVSSTVSVDGALNISLTNGFRPTAGQTFQILTYSSRIGMFATINGLNLGGGLVLQPAYASTGLVLTAVQNQQPELAAATHSGGAFNFQLTGPAGQAVLIETSTDLVNWTPVSTNTLSAGPLNFITSNTPASSRFYRALVVP